MQLDAVAIKKHTSHSLQLSPDTLEQHETPRQAPVALTPYGLRKILTVAIKGCFLTIHRFHLINFSDV